MNRQEVEVHRAIVSGVERDHLPARIAADARGGGDPGVCQPVTAVRLPARKRAEGISYNFV